MADKPYFLDFLFNDIVDVHFGGDYLAFHGYADESDTFMRTWTDGLFFDNQPTANFFMGWDESINQLVYGVTGSIRIVNNSQLENVTLKKEDFDGKLKTVNGATLKNSFLVGVLNGNSNAALVAFIALSNFKQSTLQLECNTAPEQPVGYKYELLTYKASDIGAGKKVGAILPGKATSKSRLVNGGELSRWTLDVHRLKLTERH